MTTLAGTSILVVLTLGGAPKRKVPAYRTQVPKITAARWTKRTRAPKPGRVTRDSYMDFIKRTYKKSKDYYLSVAGKPQAAHQDTAARQAAFFYLAEKNKAWAELAMKFIRGDYAFRTQGRGSGQGTGSHITVPASQT